MTRSLKLSFLLFLLLILQQTFAQNTRGSNQFTLKGQITGIRMDSVLLYYQNDNGERIFQSKPIFNGIFIINDNISRPVHAVILFKNEGEVLRQADYESRMKEIYLEPAPMVLAGDVSKPALLKLSGSTTQDEWDEPNSVIIPIRDEMQPLTKQLAEERDAEKALQIQTKFEPYEDKIKAITYRFFLTHPNSYATLDKMQTYVRQVSLDSSKRVYNAFNIALKQTHEARYIASEIRKMESALPGNMAQGFTVKDINGNEISLADYKGKYVLIDFWASWCPPCRQGNPHLVTIYNKYKARGLNIIGIALNDSTPAAWKAAVQKDGIGLWPQALSGSGTFNDIGQKYAIHFVPTKILVDPTGKIIGRFGDNNAYADGPMDRMLATVFGK